MKKHTKRSNPELAKGAPIDDLEYDEVTDMLDVVLAQSRAVVEESTSRVRAIAKRIEHIASDGPPTTPQRRLA